MGQDTGQLREEIEQTRTQMTGTVDALAHKADVKTRVKDSIGDKRDRLREQITGTSSRLDEATPDADELGQGARRAAGVAQENPIGLAVGGLAAGFLVGMLLPTSKVEDERLGAVSDELKDKARETGQEALERGKDVTAQATEQAVETAKEAAGDHAEEMRPDGDGSGGSGQGPTDSGAEGSSAGGQRGQAAQPTSASGAGSPGG